MKPKQPFLFILSLLLASYFSTSVYGNDSSQKIGDDNQCPSQIKDSPGTTITCNITQPSNSDPPKSIPENRQNVFPTNPDDQSPLSNWCEDPELSNEDKHALGCLGY